MMTSRAGWGQAIRELDRAFELGRIDTDLSDAALLDRFVGSRDEPAFATLVDRHGPMILATARAIVRSLADAEDVFQATFLILARRGSSIRRGESIAGWLHQVARRVALRAVADAAARRRHEQVQAHERPTGTAPSDRIEAGAEAARLIHEELGRLPSRYRSAVVLCDLEALSRDQAALALGWPAGTVASRLDRGRRLLRDRLIRRGGDGATWLSTLERSRAILVPPLWAAAAVRAALTHSSAALAGRVLRSMTVATVAAWLGGFAVVLGSFVLVNSGGRSPQLTSRLTPPPLPVVAPLAVPVPALAPAEPGSSVVFRGQVVDPNGAPVAAARVFLVDPGKTPAIPPTPPAQSDARGRFEFTATVATTVPPGATNQAATVDPDRYRLLAIAPRFGVGFVRPQRSGPNEIALTRDDGPIQGRIVDSAGQPVAGARINGLKLLVPPLGKGGNGGIAGWLARGRAVADLAGAQTLLTDGLDPALSGPDLAAAVQVSAATDADGRFAITGLGQDRALSALIAGPEIATQGVIFTTEPLAAPVVVNPGHRRREPGRPGFDPAVTILGTNPTLTARLGRTIAGIVRDADSGQPLSGVKVRLDDAFSALNWEYLTESTTDGLGRYQIDGVRNNARAQLSTHASPDSRRLNVVRLLDIEVGGATEPVPADFALQAGVWVDGRVDAPSYGSDRHGIRIKPLVPPDNSFVRRLAPGTLLPENSVETERDGRFRVLVYPGPGFLTADGNRADDPFAIGWENTVGLARGTGPLIDFVTLPDPLVPRVVSSIVRLDPPLGQDSLTVVVPLPPTRERSGTAVGPDGEPVTAGLTAYNLAPDENGNPHPIKGTFTVKGLVPGRLRRIFVRQDDQQRVGILDIPDAEGPPLTVRLRRWGAVRVRIDAASNPPREWILGAQIAAEGGNPLFWEGAYNWANRTARLDSDRFEVQALDEDRIYDITCAVPGKSSRVIARQVRVRSGQTIDLGTIRVDEPF